VLDEHTIVEKGDDGYSTYRVFKNPSASTGFGNVYREFHGRAIDNYNRTFIPIIDGIVRDDLRISGAPFDAIARLLQREGILS
jgi:hypothetical protein